MNKKDKLDIICEDKELLVVNKHCGLLTIATDKEKEKIIKEKTGGKSQQKIYVPVCHFGTDLSLTCDKDTCRQVKNTDSA